MRLRNLIGNILNIFFKAIFTAGLLAIFIACLQLVLNNIFHLRNFKKGEVSKVLIKEDESPEFGTRLYKEATIIINGKEEVLSQNIYDLEVGDSVVVRDVGTKYNNIVFEINGNTVGSPYDMFDYVSPFLMLISGFFIYFFVFRPAWYRLRKRYKGF